MLTQEQINEAMQELNYKPYKPQDAGGSELRGKALFDKIDQETPTQTQFPVQDTGEEPGFGGKVLGTIGEGIKGVGKGALSTIKGTAGLGERALSYLTGGGKLERTSAEELQSQAEKGLGIEEGTLTTPTNLAQKVGFGAEQLGEFLIPGGAIGKATKAVEGVKALQGAGKVSKLARGVAKLAPEAIAGAGQQAIQEGDTSDFLKNAMLFGTFNVAGKGLKSVGKFATEKLPGKIYSSAVKPSIEETRKAIMFNGKTLGEELVNRGLRGTDRQLLDKSLRNINTAEDKLQTILKESKEVITKDELSKYLEPLVDKFSKTPGMADDFNGLVKVLDETPKIMNLAEANETKRKLYDALRDVAFKLDPALSSKKESMKALAKGLKTEIEKKTEVAIGKDVVRNINQDLAINGKLYDNISKKLALSERHNLLGLGDLGIGTIGTAAGGGGIGTAAVALKKIAGTTLFKTNAAVALDRLGKKLSELPVDKAGKISEVALVKILDELSSDDR